MNQASVGFHCPECAKTGSQKVYRGTAALRSKPVLTQVLIGLNVAVFALGAFMDSGDAVQGGITDLHFDYSLIGELPRSGVPYGVGDGEWYRMITSGFLHYGIFHLLLNMYALWILGGAVEQMGGRARLAASYLVSILVGSLGALVVTPDALTAGASGGVFGLMGVILIAQRLQGLPFRESPLIGILFINLLFTFGIPNISVGGHIGGLVGGALAGFVMFSPDVRRQSPALGYVLCAAIAVASVVGGVLLVSG